MLKGTLDPSPVFDMRVDLDGIPAGYAAAGLTKEVSFEPVEDPINDRIDDAYRAKCGGSPYLAPAAPIRARFGTASRR